MRRLRVVLAIGALLALAGCGPASVGSSGAAPSTPQASATPEPQRYRYSGAVLEDETHGPQLCLGGVAESFPPQCGGIDVVGLNWDEVETAESARSTTWADMTLVGTYDGQRFVLTEPPALRSEPAVPPSSSFAPACDDPSGDPTVTKEGWFAAQGDGSNPAIDLSDASAVWVQDPGTERDVPFILNVLVPPGRKADFTDRIRARYDGLLCVVERDLPTMRELERIQEEVHALSGEPPLETVFASHPEPQRGFVVIEVAVADAAARSFARSRWGDLVEVRGLLEPVD